jgi:5-methylcytosine-specific restriction endonuclease McrA
MTGRRITDEIRARVRAAAGERCGYCLSPQYLILGQLEIEHIIPRARGGSDDEDNLWLACRLCNNAKGVQTECLDPDTGQRVRLFDPRRQSWTDHFSWSADGTRVLGQTPCGRATVLALQLNGLVAVTVRRCWVAAGWHPPK